MTRYRPRLEMVMRRALIGISLVITCLVTSACNKPAPPPPDSGAFRATDKFFDVKAVGKRSFLLLAYGSKLAKSDDWGATWRKIQPPTRENLTRLSFADEKHGWGVGHDGVIFATEDGGDSWKEQESGTKQTLFDVEFVNQNRGFAVGDQSSVVATVDGGRTWHVGKVEMSMIGVREDMSLAISDPIYYGLNFIDENTGWIVGEFGQIRVTKDGGATWQPQHGSLLGGGYRDIMMLPTFFAVRFRDAQHGVAVGTYGAIVSTEDGGATWRWNQSPVSVPLYDARTLPDGNTVIVGASGVILHGSPEKGWQAAALPSGVVTWMSAVAFDGDGHGIAVGGHGLSLTSKNFGRTWEASTNG